MARTRKSRRGFTLVESIAAMVIAASGFAAIYQLYGGAANAERAAQEITGAVSLAETLLAEAQSGGAAPGQGETDGYLWTLEIAPAPDAPPGSEATLLRATAQVSAPSGRMVRLTTEMTAREDQR